MATASEVLSMLIPNGGWAVVGDEYEDIQFLECDPITKEQFETGFKSYDKWLDDQVKAKANEKTVLLQRLGITEDEARLLLG